MLDQRDQRGDRIFRKRITTRTRGLGYWGPYDWCRFRGHTRPGDIGFQRVNEHGDEAEVDEGEFHARWRAGQR